MSPKNTVLKICPICKSGELVKNTKKSMFGLSKSEVLTCKKCNAYFKQISADSFKLKLNESKLDSKFDGQVFDVENWISILKTDKTKREIELENLTKGKLPYDTNAPILLKMGEKSHLIDESKLYEPRSIRNYGGGSVSIMRGVRIYTGKAESHLENRCIDTGKIILTNKRLVF
jgi:uncharacterized protein YbaR (Trm112 family)